jgi:transcriptional regulator with XRE-family HTH domain
MENAPMTTKQELAHFITVHIALTGKTQREIAQEAGIASQNFLSMLKTGGAKVPLRRVPALAAALDVPAIDLMFMCLKAQEPELALILATLLPELPNSEDEVMLLRGYRILRERGIIDDQGVELRGLGPKGRASGFAKISRE